MIKSELLEWLKKEHNEWNAFIEHFTSDSWEKPGVAGHWSMKDVLAHLIGWNQRLVADMQAIVNSKPKPSPRWSKDLQTDDEINAWFYKENHERSVRELLDDEEEVFEQVMEVVKALPEDVEIETISQGNRNYYLVHLNDQRMQPGEFFDHYHDDHETKIRAFLKKEAAID